MVKIKICGLRSKRDIEIVNRYKPDYIGFIFAPSKRVITKEEGKEFIKLLDKDIKSVGVFVNEKIEKVMEIAEYCSLDIVQLHGEESTEYLKKIDKKYEVWKAFSVESSEKKLKNKLEEYREVSDLFLLDAYSKDARGGTGETFDWELIEGISKKNRVALAGGIKATNIEKAVDQVQPEIIDISSGVEVEGIKDEKKISEIMKKIKFLNKGEI